MKLYHPLRGLGVVTQTFEQHVKRAIANGWCYTPGNCPGGIYYYGGIDWGISVGTPVVAAMGGTVTVAQADASGYGVHVRMKSDDGVYLLIYGHLNELMVRAGQVVKTGDLLGLSGNTGNSTGPHLHFEVRKKGAPIDPAPMLTTELPSGEEQGGGWTGEAPVVPELPEGKTLYAINKRSKPSTDGARVGYVPTGAEVRFTQFVVENKNLWGCLGGWPEQWIAVYHNGDYLVELDQ